LRSTSNVVTTEGKAMVRPDKAAAVAELTEAFRDSSAAVLTEYRGLTVAELKTLRRALHGNATYVVVKNTLTKIAAKAAGVESFDALLEGPSAIAFISGDPVEVAKGLRTFGREHSHLVVKGGILDGKPLTADEIRRLADLESREVLLAKFAGGLLAPAQQLATVLAAPAAQLARLLGALQAKLADDPNAQTGGNGASAADLAPAAEPVEAEAAPESAAEAEADAPSEPEAAAESEAPAEPEAAAEPEAPAEPEPAAEATAEPATDETTTDETTTDETTDQPTSTDGVADASTDS
jgi:large subunit ribosomal protein L10